VLSRAVVDFRAAVSTQTFISKAGAADARMEVHEMSPAIATSSMPTALASVAEA
jgi:hypothetical protein